MVYKGAYTVFGNSPYSKIQYFMMVDQFHPQSTATDLWKSVLYVKDTFGCLAFSIEHIVVLKVAFGLTCGVARTIYQIPGVILVGIYMDSLAGKNEEIFFWKGGVDPFI